MNLFYSLVKGDMINFYNVQSISKQPMVFQKSQLVITNARMTTKVFTMLNDIPKSPHALCHLIPTNLRILANNGPLLCDRLYAKYLTSMPYLFFKP